MKDESVGENELLGVAVYPLSKLKDEETTNLTLDLAPSVGSTTTKDCGYISVSVSLSDCKKLITKLRSSLPESIQVKYHPFTKEEQVSAMEKEKAEVEAKKAAAKAILGSETMDAIVGGVVGGAGRLLSDGASIVGSGVGMVGTSLGSAGKFVSKNVSKSFTGI